MSAAASPSKIAVIGPGLLGGSIALAAAKLLPGSAVSIWARRPEAVAELQARKIGALASTDLATVARGADLVVLCVPIGAMPALARELAAIVPSRCVVTDVGSVKGPVVQELEPIFNGLGVFIGSHPMAGSEQTGLGAARADLFSGSVCIVTPGASTPLPALLQVETFWRALGCRVRQLDPETHDQVVAAISHTPHVTAAALVQAASHWQKGAALDFAGPGFRDATRIAGGPPEMWTEILTTNSAAVRNSVEEVIAKLQEFLRLLDLSQPHQRDRAIQEFLALAKAQRDTLRSSL